MRRFYLESEAGGEPVFRVHNGPTYEAALEMLSADVEYLAYAEKARRLQEQRELKKKAFWLSLFEESGLDEDGSLHFDPQTGTVRKNCRKTQSPPDSYRATVEEFRNLVAEALMSPLVACRMAHDPILPQWLQELGRVLTSGNLRLSLRRVIESCVAEPAEAHKWHETGSEDGMPDWFVEMTAILAGRRKRCDNAKGNL